MRIANPGESGFSLNEFLGKMTRQAIKGASGSAAAISTSDFLSSLYPTADISWIDTVSNWVSQGFNAVKQFLGIGSITSSVIEATPIVPIQVFPVNVSDRLIIAGDFVGQSQSGQELTRRITYMSANEDDALRDIMDRQTFDLLQKIRSTNKDEAEEYIFRFFEAHWMGRIF